MALPMACIPATRYAVIKNARFMSHRLILQVRGKVRARLRRPLRVDPAEIGQHVVATDYRREVAPRLIDHRANDRVVRRIHEKGD
jgi:hypothetical protein